MDHFEQLVLLHLSDSKYDYHSVVLCDRRIAVMIQIFYSQQQIEISDQAGRYTRIKVDIDIDENTDRIQGFRMFFGPINSEKYMGYVEHGSKLYEPIACYALRAVHNLFCTERTYQNLHSWSDYTDCHEDSCLAKTPRSASQQMFMYHEYMLNIPNLMSQMRSTFGSDLSCVIAQYFFIKEPNKII